MSGLLYTLYTNEVPLLHNLLHDNIYTQMTNDTNMTTYKDIEHYTINFVDDSTSIITFKTTNMVKDYLQKYYRLIHDYYTINKLKINSDKTQLMLTYKPKHKDYFKYFFFLCKQWQNNKQNSYNYTWIHNKTQLRYDNPNR